MSRNYSNFWKALGPGLIWAGAAVGVSHLVQSTRAGAEFGFQLIGIVVLANILKYPFFQFGPRYAIAANESLIEGYHRQGKWVVWLFLFLTLGTMFTIMAAVTSVTVGIISSVFPSSLSYVQVTILLLLVCGTIVLIGHYRTLDRIMKGVVVLLTLSTVFALVAAAMSTDFNYTPTSFKPDWNIQNIAFIVALAGWMPSAIDISVWNSLWTIAKIKDTGYKPSLKEAMTDFNIGYIGTAVMSVIFLSLGALVMFGRGEVFAQSGVAFSGQFLSLYTDSIGQWAYPVIAIAAIATMFSTTLTVLDAYPRVMVPVTKILWTTTKKQVFSKYLKGIWLLIVIAGAVIIINVFSSKMKLLVDIATTLSFVTAPVLGYLNLKAITGKHVQHEMQPGFWLKLLTWTCIVVLSGFTIYYLYLRLTW